MPAASDHMISILDPNIEIDDEADPDYEAADLMDLVDREELRYVNISRKEMDDLFNELSKIMDDPNEMTNGQSLGDTEFMADRAASALNTPTKDLDHSIGSPISSAATFDPQSMSTPLVMRGHMPGCDSTINETLVDSTVTDAASTIQWPINPVTFSPVKEGSPIVLYQAIQGGNLIPIVVTMSTMPISTAAIATTEPAPLPSLTNESLQCLNRQMAAGKPTNTHRTITQRSNDVEYLQQLDPNSIVKPTFPDHAVGFTEHQKQLLEQQLRMHVQLATQGYLQAYGHPMLYPKAPVFRGYLVRKNDESHATQQKQTYFPIIFQDELHHIISASPTQIIRIANLPWATSLATEWEAELSMSSEANTELVAFIQGQWTKCQRGRQQQKVIQMQFPDRIMQKIIDSKVFIYSTLLPLLPFFDKQYKVKNLTIAEE